METKYFRLKFKCLSDSPGIGIRLSEGKLSIISGGLWNLDEMVSLDERGNLSCDFGKYLLSDIDEKEADKMKEDYANWIMKQYVATNPNPISVIEHPPLR